jgi:hypothetical protein
VSRICDTITPRGTLLVSPQTASPASALTVVVVEQDGELPLVLLLVALGVGSVRAEHEGAVGLPVGEEACSGRRSSDDGRAPLRLGS